MSKSGLKGGGSLGVAEMVAAMHGLGSNTDLYILAGINPGKNCSNVMIVEWSFSILPDVVEVGFFLVSITYPLVVVIDVTFGAVRPIL